MENVEKITQALDYLTKGDNDVFNALSDLIEMAVDAGTERDLGTFRFKKSRFIEKMVEISHKLVTREINWEFDNRELPKDELKEATENLREVSNVNHIDNNWDFDYDFFDIISFLTIESKEMIYSKNEQEFKQEKKDVIDNLKWLLRRTKKTTFKDAKELEAKITKTNEEPEVESRLERTRPARKPRKSRKSRKDQ